MNQEILMFSETYVILFLTECITSLFSITPLFYSHLFSIFSFASL